MVFQPNPLESPILHAYAFVFIPILYTCAYTRARGNLVFHGFSQIVLIFPNLGENVAYVKLVKLEVYANPYHT